MDNLPSFAKKVLRKRNKGLRTQNKARHQPPGRKQGQKRPQDFGQSHGGSWAGGATATTPPSTRGRRVPKKQKDQSATRTATGPTTKHGTATRNRRRKDANQEARAPTTRSHQEAGAQQGCDRGRKDRPHRKPQVRRKDARTSKEPKPTPKAKVAHH